MKSAARLCLYLLVGGTLLAVSSAHAAITGGFDIAPRSVTLVPELRAALLGGIGMLILLRRRKA